MNRSEAWAALARARVARLATTRPDGAPHLVPVTFATDGENIVTMVDHKPKTTTRLRRLDNIEDNPMVSLLADHYSEDWEWLWWVRADGMASIHREGAWWQRARQSLEAKYAQYASSPPDGPAIVVSVTGLTWWEST